MYCFCNTSTCDVGIDFCGQSGSSRHHGHKVAVLCLLPMRCAVNDLCCTLDWVLGAIYEYIDQMWSHSLIRIVFGEVVFILIRLHTIAPGSEEETHHCVISNNAEHCSIEASRQPKRICPVLFLTCNAAELTGVILSTVVDEFEQRMVIVCT